jgi:hypothetical protein
LCPLCLIDVVAGVRESLRREKVSDMAVTASLGDPVAEDGKTWPGRAGTIDVALP